MRGWMKQKNGFTVRRLWHPLCWIDQGQQYLLEHPLQPQKGGPGRPRLDIDDSGRKQRHALTMRQMRRMAKRRWLAQQYMETPDAETRQEILRLLAEEDRVLAEIEELIKVVGGVVTRHRRGRTGEEMSDNNG